MERERNAKLNMKVSKMQKMTRANTEDTINMSKLNRRFLTFQFWNKRF